MFSKAPKLRPEINSRNNKVKENNSQSFAVNPKTLNHCHPLNTDYTVSPYKSKASKKGKMAAFSGSRFKEFLKKYGKVALGVHFSVSAASITSLYVAIKNNVDVESLFDKLHLPGLSKDEKNQNPYPQSPNPDGSLMKESTVVIEEKQRNRTAELAASTGGALALAVICNKALFPVRAPITIALTPPIARFLARRRIIKNSV